MNALLEIKHLHKSFGGVLATDDLNLAVAAGTTHAIIGPNGAGKTTLIRQLSGELRPDSGSMIFAGQSLNKGKVHYRARLGLARSFQITSLILAMTVRENALLAVQSLAGHAFKFWSPVSDEKPLQLAAEQCLAAVGLADKADALAGEIAYGEQRQLELALALALKPKLLLLDEPMAGMSKQESAAMIALLKSLHGGTTILLIEHDMHAVFALADTTSVLVNGHIIATDSTAAIRNNPAVAKAYLGDAAQHAAWA